MGLVATARRLLGLPPAGLTGDERAYLREHEVVVNFLKAGIHAFSKPLMGVGHNMNDDHLAEHVRLIDQAIISDAVVSSVELIVTLDHIWHVGGDMGTQVPPRFSATHGLLMAAYAHFTMMEQSLSYWTQYGGSIERHADRAKTDMTRANQALHQSLELRRQALI